MWFLLLEIHSCSHDVARVMRFTHLQPVYKDPILQSAALCIWCLHRAMYILDGNNLILPADEANQYHRLLRKSLLHWQGLALDRHAKGIMRWKLRPKHHMVDHISEDVMRTRLSPRLLMQCFQDESYLGQIKQVGIHCHSAQMMTRLFQRLMILWAVRFKDSRAAQVPTQACEARRRTA